MRATITPAPRLIHAVATENFAGVERYITYIAPELARRGVQVVVLGGDDRLMRVAFRGSDVEYVASSNLPSMVRTLLATSRADVIHAHMTKAEVASAICKHRLRSALVVTRHFAARRGRTPWSRAAGRAVAQVVDLQIAISQYVSDEVEGHSEVLLTGVPCGDVGPHDQPIVLVAQRLEAEKDGAIAIEAWALSGLADMGWRLVFAGDGVELAFLNALASRHGVDNSVSFLGFVEDVHGLMAGAALLLAPAPREPFGLTVVEAMARGLPVVAAAAGGHSETVGVATPAATFPPGDASSAAKLLKQLGNNPDLRREYGERNLRFQREELSIESHVDQLMTAYASVSRRFEPTSSSGLADMTDPPANVG
jgi:glycosyltransferase involved in cell wall biosynthesis